MTSATRTRIDLAELKRMKSANEKFAMLTAYDHPTAAAAQAAGIHSLLIGDSLGMVVLGETSTRGVPLDLIVMLARAVRRGAPELYVVGDLPFECMGSTESVVSASLRFRDEAGCDAVKFEAQAGSESIVRALSAKNIETIVHLGLRPQSVETPDGYRAQARDQQAISGLVEDVKRLVDAGAAAVLLEAVPNEASQAVVDAVGVPVIGCGAGPACDGHVVVTHDLLGIGDFRPPRFVPVLAHVGKITREAMSRYASAITTGEYPAAQHVYPMKKQGGAANASS